MKNTTLTLIALFCTFLSYGQNSRFSISAHYGLASNFFVRSYDEEGGPVFPGRMYFYKKNLIGSIGGFELKYALNAHSGFGAAFSRSVNKARKNYLGQNGNTTLAINDFQITHANDFFQMYYERNFIRSKPSWKYHAGLVYALMHQQEIENLPNFIVISERNYKNSGLEEGGVFGGIEYAKKIDTHFDFGLKARVYYLISVQQLEAISLTPVLTYHF